MHAPNIMGSNPINFDTDRLTPWGRYGDQISYVYIRGDFCGGFLSNPVYGFPARQVWNLLLNNPEIPTLGDYAS